MWHALGSGEVFTGFWLGGPTVRDHWEDPGVDRRIKMGWTLGRLRSMGRTGFGWLRMGAQWRAFVNTVMNLRVP
jgi:hypothetical protein